MPPKLSFAASALLLCTATAIWGGDEKLATDPGNTTNSVDVIGRFKVTPGETHHQKIIRRGGLLKHRPDVIRCGRYSVFPALLRELSNDPQVESISPDRPVHGMLNIAVATVGGTIANTSGLTGSGIGVAVIDNGISDKPNFHGQHTRLAYFQSFVGGGQNDQYGHGTHVAGILGDGEPF